MVINTVLFGPLPIGQGDCSIDTVAEDGSHDAAFMAMLLFVVILVDGQGFLTCVLFGLDSSITSKVAAKLSVIGAGLYQSATRCIGKPAPGAFRQYVDDFDGAAVDDALMKDFGEDHGAGNSLRRFESDHSLFLGRLSDDARFSESAGA